MGGQFAEGNCPEVASNNEHPTPNAESTAEPREGARPCGAGGLVVAET